MTDLEITRLCADAMLPDIYLHPKFDPLHDDAQAMALVKKFGIEIHSRTDRNGWYAGINEEDEMTPHADLNRAICECVAKMQQAKAAA